MLETQCGIEKTTKSLSLLGMITVHIIHPRQCIHTVEDLK